MYGGLETMTSKRSSCPSATNQDPPSRRTRLAKPSAPALDPFRQRSRLFRRDEACAVQVDLRPAQSEQAAEQLFRLGLRGLRTARELGDRRPERLLNGHGGGV